MAVSGQTRKGQSQMLKTLAEHTNSATSPCPGSIPGQALGTAPETGIHHLLKLKSATISAVPLKYRVVISIAPSDRRQNRFSNTPHFIAALPCGVFGQPASDKAD